jgi:WD40 repeat protein
MASSSKAPTPWFLASAAEDVKLWRSGGQAEASPRARDAHAVRCVRFDNTGQLLGSCGDDGCVHITSVAPGGQQGAVTLRPDDSTAATNCFSFSSGSGYLSSGAADGVIRVWDTKQQRVLQRFDDHRGRAVTCMSFAQNDAHIASGNEAGDVLIHGLVTQRLAATLPAQSTRGPPNSPVNDLEYSRLRKSLLGTACGDGSVYVWDVNAAEKPHAAFPSQHKAACTGIAFSPVNHVLFASGSMDGNIVFYDVAQRKIVKSMPTESPITCMCFHDDGVTVAVGKASGDVAIYDLRSARGNKPLVVLPQAHDPLLAPTGVRSVHFQRVRRERSSRSARGGGSSAASKKERSSVSGMSESSSTNVSVASSRGGGQALGGPSTTAARAPASDYSYDPTSARSSMRSSVAASESSSTYMEQPPTSAGAATSAADPAPPVYSPAGRGSLSQSQHHTDAAESGSGPGSEGISAATTPRMALPGPSHTPQSAVRQQKTEAFQAKTNALLAKLDQMSPAAAAAATQPLPQQQSAAASAGPEETAGRYDAVDADVEVELAPGLNQRRGQSMAKVGEEAASPGPPHNNLDDAASSWGTSVTAAARMSPPAAAAATAATVAPSVMDAAGPSPMFSPVAKPAQQTQRLEFSNAAAAAGAGAGRVTTAWGSEDLDLDAAATAAAAAAPAPAAAASRLGTAGVAPTGGGMSGMRHPSAAAAVIDPPAVFLQGAPTATTTSRTPMPNPVAGQGDGREGASSGSAAQGALQVGVSQPLCCAALRCISSTPPNTLTPLSYRSVDCMASDDLKPHRSPAGSLGGWVAGCRLI